MKKVTPKSPTRPSTAAIRQYVSGLPTIPEPLLLDERAAQAARSILELHDPSWKQRISAQIDTITKEVVTQLDYDSESQRYAITDLELRGIVAQAVSRASGQFAVNIGQALEQSPVLAAQFIATQDDRETAALTSLKQAKLPQE